MVEETTFVVPSGYAGINGIVIETLSNNGNEKGAVFNFPLLQYKTTDIAFFDRPAGIKSPAHFHTGLDPSFDPQVLFLTKGKMRMKFWDLHKKEVEHEVYAGQTLSIPTFVLHDYETIEDTVFIELRTVAYKDVLKDLFLEEDFKSIEL
jgi:dTDP-4-dehydrorhamnose 3,5-epimerase-like enzyme